MRKENIYCNMKYTVARAFSFATKNFVRNVGISMVTVAILTIALLSLNTLFLLKNATDAGLSAIQDNVAVRLQFRIDAPTKKVDEVVKMVSTLPEVERADFVSSDEVKKEFVVRHTNDKDILAALNALQNNPFGSALKIKAKTPDEYTKILEAISANGYNSLIEQKTFGDHEAYISKISKLSKNITTVATVISILFVCFAVFIIFNAIRVTVYSQREEIAIMRLVGATNGFIRAPYYLESMYYTLISIIAAFSVTYFLVQVADPFIASSLGAGVFSLQAEFIHKLPILLFLEFLGIGLLTIGASTFAMRRYLKI